VYFFAPLLLSSHLLAVADSVPVFDVKKICQGPAIEAKRCIESEEATREKLKTIWGQFSAKDKAGCVATAKIGGNPSYTELITCLEMIRDLDKRDATSSNKPVGKEADGPRRKRR
jgi:hypothetical protein